LILNYKKIFYEEEYDFVWNCCRIRCRFVWIQFISNWHLGKVTPQDGAESVWAIGTDSTKGIITSGNFSIQVKPGTYKVFVDARDPFKDVSLENLEVRDGQPLDVGEIVLQK
jgi:hypothetical protein